jgi:hypothetical protein
MCLQHFRRDYFKPPITFITSIDSECNMRRGIPRSLGHMFVFIMSLIGVF